MSWDCPCARGKLPNPTSRVGQQAGRTPLSRPPTLGTAAAGPVTPAGRVGGGRDGRLETFFPAKNDGRLTQWQSATNRGNTQQSDQPRNNIKYIKSFK